MYSCKVVNSIYMISKWILRELMNVDIYLQVSNISDKVYNRSDK